MGLSTQQLRYEFPDLVAGGVSSSWVVYGTRPICDWSQARPVRFLAAGASYPAGYVDLLFHPDAVDLATAWAASLYGHAYPFRETAGGSVACRKITGGTRTTLHAHGVAVDVNPSKNRYRVKVGPIQFGRDTDWPQTMVRTLEMIRATNGEPLTEWGGRWWNIKDPMHLQPKTWRRYVRAVDWGTVPHLAVYRKWVSSTGAPIEEDTLRTSRKGDSGEHVAALMELLSIAGHAPANSGGGVDPWDGIFGAGMASAVNRFQTADGRPFPSEGPDYVGPITLARLTAHPVPVKFKRVTVLKEVDA